MYQVIQAVTFFIPLLEVTNNHFSGITWLSTDIPSAPPTWSTWTSGTPMAVLLFRTGLLAPRQRFLGGKRATKNKKKRNHFGIDLEKKRKWVVLFSKHLCWCRGFFKYSPMEACSFCWEKAHKIPAFQKGPISALPALEVTTYVPSSPCGESWWMENKNSSNSSTKTWYWLIFVWKCMKMFEHYFISFCFGVQMLKIRLKIMICFCKKNDIS